MTITAVKQFTIQPKDTFETLRQRLTKGDRLNPNTTSELVFSRTDETDLRWDSIDIMGATAFSMRSRGEPFLRHVTAGVGNQESQYSYYDRSPVGADTSIGISAMTHRSTVRPTYTNVVFDEQRDAEMDARLRAICGAQREVNRQFLPVIEAARETILERWLAGYGEANFPRLDLADLHVPAMEYLSAMGISQALHVLPVKMARSAVGRHLYDVPDAVVRSPKHPVDVSVPKRAVPDVTVGDVVHGAIGDYEVTSIQHHSGLRGRECLVWQVRYLFDGRTDAVAFALNDDRDRALGGIRVLGRA